MPGQRQQLPDVVRGDRRAGFADDRDRARLHVVDQEDATWVSIAAESAGRVKHRFHIPLRPIRCRLPRRRDPRRRAERRHQPGRRALQVHAEPARRQGWRRPAAGSQSTSRRSTAAPGARRAAPPGSSCRPAQTGTPRNGRAGGGIEPGSRAGREVEYRRTEIHGHADGRAAPPARRPRRSGTGPDAGSSTDSGTNPPSPSPSPTPPEPTPTPTPIPTPPPPPAAAERGRLLGTCPACSGAAQRDVRRRGMTIVTDS